MADPITWQLLGDVETCLKQVKKIDGYHTDAGANVTKEPVQFAEGAGARFHVRLGPVSRSAAQGMVRTHRTATVVITALAPATTDRELRIHELLEDIERAFRGAQSRFGAGREFPQFAEANPIPFEAGQSWAGLEVRYTTNVQLG